MNILVTGAAGFVGSFVCRRLLNENHHVRMAVKPGAANHCINEFAGRFETVGIDLFHASKAQLDALTCKVDLTIHCAWYARPGKYLTAEENIPALEGSLHLFESLWRNGCRRLVGVGTCAEYEMSSQPLSESAPTNPATLYSAAKLSTFLMGRELARLMGGSFAWARLFYLYGPQESPRRLVPDLAINLLQGKRVAVTEGRQIRDYLHVEDVASALVEIAFSEIDGAINVGSGQPVQVRTLVEAIARSVGRESLVDYGARAANLLDPPFMVADNNLLLRSTNWTARYDLSAGIENTIEWWRSRI